VISSYFCYSCIGDNLTFRAQTNLPRDAVCQSQSAVNKGGR